MGSSGETEAGRQVRQHRLRLGLTQEELAGRARISVRALRDIERGRVARPRDQSLRHLAAALDLPERQRRELLAVATPAEPPTGALSIGVLGPLTVRVGATTLPLRSTAQQSLLGLLALHPGYPISVGEMSEVLWSGRAPSVWRNLVHVHVSRLRDVLEPGRGRRVQSRVIASVNRAYRLDIDVELLDLSRFDHLVESARRAVRDAQPERGRQLYEEALACWRGPVLAGSGERLRQHPAALAAHRRRLSAALAFAASASEAGEHGQVKRWLLELVGEEPLHEGLHAHLMTALAGSGEQAAALRLFGDIRARLAEELGVDPGPELQAAHRHVLQGHAAASSSATPRQLPATIDDFTGRDDELRQLDTWLNGGRSTIAITGGAGIGKTALAVHWARTVAARRGHGHLYLNLNGYGRGRPVHPIEALSYLLRCLGVDGQAVPVDIEAAAGLYRTLLAGNRMLVVLDNASDGEQVRPLLPGEADNLVVITSRDRLSGLVAKEGVRRLELSVLEPREAVALIAHIVGNGLVAAEPSAADELARLCAYLPLALRIAAANIPDRRYRSMSDLVVGLGGRGWPGALEIEGDPQARVSAAFDSSYSRVDPRAKRLFRLLGFIPGSDFTPAVTAALAGEDVEQVQRDLRILSDAYLLSQPAPGRFAFHDLLRRYAMRLGVVADADAERARALRRLYDHYLVTADAAATAVNPQMLRLAFAPDQHGDDRPEFADQTEALAWLDTERANLIAAIHQAPADGFPQTSWLLSDMLRGYFGLRRHMVEWVAAAGAALTTSQTAGDGAGQVAARLSLSAAQWWQGHRAEAVEHLAPAVDLARQIGWHDGVAACLGNLGGIYGEWGRLEQAAAYLAEAVEHSRHHGTPAPMTANNLTNLGALCHDLGRLTEAYEHHAGALALFSSIGARSGTAVAETNLGGTLLALGRLDESEQHLASALAVFRELEARHDEASALIDLARLRFELGRTDEAAEDARLALDAARDAKAADRIAGALNMLGRITVDPALHEQALKEGAGVRQAEAAALIGLAETLAALGECDRAIVHGEAALALAREAGFRLVEGCALTVLAEIHLRQGEEALCQMHAERALAIHRECRSDRMVLRTAGLLH